MDSRLIYETSKHLKSKIHWKHVIESEWIYCGSNGEVKFDIVLKHIKDHFIDSKLYVVLTRNDSFETNKEIIIKTVEQLVGSIDFLIWDFRFERVIEFNKVGVFREGKSVASIRV
ncbi:MAG TPA: hypothetical protein VJ111_02620 [Chitinophagaceae bacterium]|nr:hypothetical protein [Chitinophagaceae bacterium]